MKAVKWVVAKLQGDKTWQAPKSTRKRNTPENAGNRPCPDSAFSGVLRFRVCFGALSEGNKEHPKTQHPRTGKGSPTCVFGCVAFCGCFWLSPEELLLSTGKLVVAKLQSKAATGTAVSSTRSERGIGSAARPAEEPLLCTT